MGRPRKAAVPKDAPEPAKKSPAKPTTAGEALQTLAEEGKARQAAGKSLQNHHVRALRDAWLYDMAQYVWTSADVAAADLGVSPATFRGYADQGCPGIEPHSPIPKAPVLRWLLQHAHERGGDRAANRDSIEQVDLRLKLAKAEREERALIAQAEDRANQGIVLLMAELREVLLRDLPGQLAADVRDATDHTHAEEIILRRLTDALRDRRIAPPQET